MVFILGSGFAQAVMPLVAAARGSGDETRIRRDTRMGLWLSILYGILVYPVFWFSARSCWHLDKSPKSPCMARISCGSPGWAWCRRC